jgi:hypothetical protein
MVLRGIDAVVCDVTKERWPDHIVGRIDAGPRQKDEGEAEVVAMGKGQR